MKKKKVKKKKTEQLQLRQALRINQVKLRPAPWMFITENEIYSNPSG